MSRVDWLRNRSSSWCLPGRIPQRLGSTWNHWVPMLQRNFGGPGLPWGLQGDRGEVNMRWNVTWRQTVRSLSWRGLYPKMREISSVLILRTLDEFQDRIAASPSIWRRQALDFRVTADLWSSSDRTDIPWADVGRREYSYLPLLAAGRTVGVTLTLL